MERLIKQFSHQFLLVFGVMSLLFNTPTHAGSVVQLQSHNIQDILDHNELVFINFYADWCRFSQLLTPIFEQTAEALAKDFPEQGKVVLAKVDCDRESSIASQYHISKYPTLKLVRYGQLVKREFRGQRSPEAMANFIKEQIREVISKANNLEELEELDPKKRHVIGYFDNDQSAEYKNFAKTASQLRDDCMFHAAIGEMSVNQRLGGDHVNFRAIGKQVNDLPYIGNLINYDLLHQWTHDKCVPLVREITFENAEELTEEGLPFMIFFHHPDDTETVEKYSKTVATELLAEKKSINFLTADGLKFSHPLYHLGKTTNDLPVLAIDSFRHMYLWPHSPKTHLETPGLLKQFIQDLHSGKLHREFHHGPDATTTPPPTLVDGKQVPNDPEQDSNQVPQEQPDDGTTPPESTFKKLQPSRTRYTLLRDEL